MRLIRKVEVESGVVRVEFVPTSPSCPIAFRLAQEIKEEAKRVKGVKRSLVSCYGHSMEATISRTINREDA